MYKNTNEKLLIMSIYKNKQKDYYNSINEIDNTNMLKNKMITEVVGYGRIILKKWISVSWEK